jgi:hypothetical protein
MNIKSIHLEKVDGIFDIQPPAIPELNNLEIGLISIAIIIATSIILYLFWQLFYSNKGQNKRKIIKLEKKFQNNTISKDKTVYQLCAYLKKGMEINHIGQQTKLPYNQKLNNKQWEIFTNTLSELRYNKNKKSNADLNQLFKESLYWLKVWR